MAFNNRAIADGMFDSLPTRGTDLITIQEANITVEKTSSSMVWIGGELTYTITVSNNDTLPYTQVTITDDLNETLAVAQLVETSLSLTVGGTAVTPVVYTYVGGVLTVTVGEIAAGAQAVLSFRLQEA